MCEPMNTELTKQLKTQINAYLLAWHQTQARDLPWRRERSPYSVWVSETMLQQTQVDTVIPYYLRWMARFPSLGDLAQAPLDDVLKAWEGLGYYARARNLHQAARMVIAEHGGQVPADPALLSRLPGIGRYTLGAIRSLAFGQDAAVLDGNVKRVLSRVFAIEGDPATNAVHKQLWQLAEALVPPGRAGEFNEALMDLGATICTPRSPACPACPLQTVCQAHLQGREAEFPHKTPRKRTPQYPVASGIVWRDGRVLIAQRPLDGLLGGLWEFPGGKQEAGETLPQCLQRELGEELAIEVEVGELLARVEHAFTHFRITLYAFECRWLHGEPQRLGVADYRWVTLDELDQFAFPRTDRQVIEVLRGSAPRQLALSV